MRRNRFTLTLLLICLTLITSPAISEPMYVGVILAKTGVAARSNVDFLPGLYLAVDEINENGGLLGRAVEIVEYDVKSTSFGAQLAAEEAVRDGVIAVIGAVWSSHSLAAARVLQLARIPMITPSSTHPDVTKVGNYIFRACYIDTFQGAVMADFAYSDLGVRKAAVLKNTARLYSIELSAVFIRRFGELGGEIVLLGEYVNTTTDFADFLEKVRATDTEVVFLPSGPAEAIVVLRQARGMGVLLPFLGGDAWSPVMSRYSGYELDNGYYSDHWHVDLPGEANQSFVRRFTEQYGPIGNSGAPLTYDAMMLLADAIARAGSVEGPMIRRALADTKDFAGVTGSISMGEWGDPLKSAVIVSLSADESVLVKVLGLAQ